MEEQIKKLLKEQGKSRTEELQLDNLDFAFVYLDEDDELMVENEHGSSFSFDDLSIDEQEMFLISLGGELPLDYIILTEKNKWLSYDKQATSTEIKEEIENLKERYPDEKLILVTARKLKITTI